MVSFVKIGALKKNQVWVHRAEFSFASEGLKDRVVKFSLSR